MYQIKVPATSANLGPGFDCMGLAVKLYNTFTIEESSKLQIILKGTYTSNIATDETNLFWRSANILWKKISFKPIPLKITFNTQVPPARGLGSSSTAVVGGLMAANAFAGNPLDKLELLEIATSIEKHPDNVCPALFGGVTLTVMTENSLIPRILTKNPKFKAVVIIPDIMLRTEKARNILPKSISRQDAVFNASRVGLLVDVFLTEDYDLLAVATQDKIHQNQRAELIPGVLEALQTAINSGAYGAALSGSGPSLIAFCPNGKELDVATNLQRILSSSSITSKYLILDVDPDGAILTKY
ncbi:MAG: homoserine kinase [Peptococcaceae bacterium]|jgi:homoserine kinase|nr:homoserine kinase [Peptococcaceae bacterium]